MSASPTLPYAHLNLRRNPFGELEPEERAALAVVDVADLARRLQGPGVAVQLLGGSGCGKTTHLLALRRRFPNAPFVKVHDVVRTRIPRGHPLLVDDAHLMTSARLRRMLRRSVSFVLATHHDLSADVARCGLEAVVLRPAERLSAERLADVFTRRVEAARRGPGPVPRVPPAIVGRLVERHRDDVRSMEQALYEAFANLQECGDVEV